MKNVKKSVRCAVLVAAVLAGLTATACNTVEGAGKDIKETGKAIEKAADKNK